MGSLSVSRMAGMRRLLALLVCIAFYSVATALPQGGGGLEALRSKGVKRGCGSGKTGACCSSSDCPQWAPICSEHGYCQLSSYKPQTTGQGGVTSVSNNGRLGGWRG